MSDTTPPPSLSGSSLAGKLLISMPQIDDKRFDKSVILICAHDAHGAMGLQINNLSDELSFSELLGQLDISSEAFDGVMPVHHGGPVDSGRGFLLHSSAFSRDDTIVVDGRYGVTGTVDALRDVVKQDYVQDMIFIMGYAGWTSGQIEKELQENVWLVAPASEQILFRTDADQIWSKAISSIGVDPTLLSSQMGHA